MALKIEPRRAWRAKPAKKFTTSDPKKLKGVVCHWFGNPKAVHDHKDCPGLLRAVQRAHQAGEFSDIAYNHAVCQHGVVYALRGFDRQTGANGNKIANRQYAAVVAMIGEGDKPSGELKAALADLIGEWRARGAGLEVKRHGEITGSACPGPELSAWVNVKGFEVKKLPAKVRKPQPSVEPTATWTGTTWTPASPISYTIATWPTPYTIDVQAGNVTLTNQDPANPAVQSRLRKLFGRFPSVTVRWKRKER